MKTVRSLGSSKLMFLSSVVLLVLFGCGNTDPARSLRALSEPEKAVVGFYNWYLERVDERGIGLVVNFSSTDSIVQIDSDAYLSNLLSSGFIDESYTQKLKNDLTECNEGLKADKQTDGVPECIAVDLVTGQQEQPQGYVTSLVEISGDKATVEAKGFGLTSENDSTYCCTAKVSLLRKGEKWVITDIN